MEVIVSISHIPLFILLYLRLIIFNILFYCFLLITIFLFLFNFKGIQNTYNLVNKSNYSIIKDEDDLKEGTLFYCTGDSVQCSEVIDVGYYIVDSSTVYTCQDIGDGLKCTKGGIDENITGCDLSHVGELFLDNNVISLCLSYMGSPVKAISIALNNSNSGTYLLEKNADPAKNVFGITGGSDKYAIVKVKDKIVTLFSTYDNQLKYVYGNMVSGKVMKREEKTCPTKTGANAGELDTNNILELFCTGGKCKDSSYEVKLSSTNEGNFYIMIINDIY